MTVTEYVIDLLLIAVVFRQIRPRELSRGSVLLPVVLVGIACVNYLRAFTPAGNDILLIVLLVVAGVVLGLVSGAVTDVWSDGNGHVIARAGLLAAAAWVAGMASRFAFAVWSTGSGATAITRFSIEHRISSGQAWTTALVLMAVGEVLARVTVLQIRRAYAQQPASLAHA
ncbi:MAG: hypothetical protein ACJ77B_09120 [Chloroflexota bacterium]